MTLEKSMGRSLGRACWVRAGLAVGLVWGGGLFLVGAIANYTSAWGHAFIDAVGSLYWGFGASWGGALFGLMWGFLAGFIGTSIAVGLYHALRRTSVARGCCLAHDMLGEPKVAEAEAGYESAAGVSGRVEQARPAGTEMPGAAGPTRPGTPASTRPSERSGMS